MPWISRPLEERFWEKVEFTDDCWIWQAAAANGYGVFTMAKNEVGRKMSCRAHRVAYQLMREAIPSGLVIDHLCRTKLCVHPWHLEAVTDKTNLMRGAGSPARNARKTHCKRHHPLADDNLIIDHQGFRQCRRCNMLRGRQKRARKNRLMRIRHRYVSSINTLSI